MKTITEHIIEISAIALLQSQGWELLVEKVKTRDHSVELFQEERLAEVI